ncbi:MAG: transcriptional activator domain-containing protein, partial [Actinomycetota bacterium]
RSLEAQLAAARAYALSRLGRHDEAVEDARRNAESAAARGTPDDEAVAAFDLGTILLQAGEHGEAAARLRSALAGTSAPLPRALARLRLAEALAGVGAPDDAQEELGRVPFEPIGPADAPEALVAHLTRIQALVAGARGDTDLARRRLDEAEAAWRRLGGAGPAGDAYTAVLVDLGRPPVAGLVEPERELARLARDRAALAVISPSVPGV